MSYNERRVFASLISGIVVSAFYILYVLPRYPQGNPYSAEVFHFWGSSVFILIPVSIASQIVVQIVSTAASTKNKERYLSDERDRLIELRGARIAFYVFVLGFMLAMGSLVFDMPPSIMFLILFFSGFAAAMAAYITQLYLYRRGF